MASLLDVSEASTPADVTLAEAAASCGVVRSVAEVDPFDLAEDEETIVIQAQLLKVGTAESFARGGELLVGIKRMIRAVTSHYGRYLDPLNAVRGEILDMKRADLSPLEQAVENLTPQRRGASFRFARRRDLFEAGEHDPVFSWPRRRGFAFDHDQALVA